MKNNLLIAKAVFTFGKLQPPTLFNGIIKATVGKTFLALSTLLIAFGATAQITYSTQPVLPGMEYPNAAVAAVQVADINGDGFVDVLYTVSSAGGIIYLQNNGSGSFSTPASNPFSAYTASTPSSFNFNNNTTIADFDGDGDVDIWNRVSGAGNDTYLKNNSGNYSTATVPAGLEFTGTATSTVQVADINGDGFVDVIYTTVAGGPLVYLQNNGSGSFSTPSPNPFSSFTGSTPAGLTFNASATIADFDGDGDLDIWSRVSGAGNDSYLQNTGGTYASSTLPAGLEFSGTAISTVQAADMNGDGFVDVIYTSSSGGGIVYLQNNGSGSFSTPASNPFGAYTGSSVPGLIFSANTSIADYDGDGDLDIWNRMSGSGNDNYLKGSGEAPVLVSASPANNATNIAIGANIVLTFSESVTAGAGNVYIRQVSNNAIVQSIPANSPAVTGSGTNTITINPPADLALNTAYYVTFDRNAITDVDEGIIFGRINTAQNVRVPITANSFLRFTTTAVPLPVSLVNFTASLANGKALLKWQTVTEQNSKDFTIQYSADAVAWKNIGSVPASGNSTQLRGYQFTDAQALQAKNYYRLLQTDLDGRQTISDVALLQPRKAAGFSVYPNPTADKITLQLADNGIATVVLYTSGGRKILQQNENTTTIQLSLKHLPAGIYQLVVEQNGNRYTQQVYRK